MHIRPSEQKRLCCSWAEQMFQSSFSSKACGVAIIIWRNIRFKHISTHCDPNGRYVIATGHLYSTHVTLLNIYGPSVDDAVLFKNAYIPSQGSKLTFLIDCTGASNFFSWLS